MKIKAILLLVLGLFSLLFSSSCSESNSFDKKSIENNIKVELEQKKTSTEKKSLDSNKDLNQKQESNQTRAIKFEFPESSKIEGYWVRLPYNFNKVKKKWPVLVYFHGAGLLESGLNELSKTGPTYYALKDSSRAGDLRNQIFSNFIIVTPHLKGTGEEYPLFWPSWSKEYKTIDFILEKVINDYSGNKEKIYLAGSSLGGAASWLLPNYLKTQIAAIVPVCGTPAGYYGKTDPRSKEKTSKEPLEMFKVDPFKKIPVWNTGNARDGWPNRIFQTTAVKQIESAGGDKFLKLTTSKPSDNKYLKHRRIFTSFDKSGHNAWTETFSSVHIYKWMLSLTNRNGVIIQK